MDSKLYLDTARVGRMTVGAQRACDQAVEFAQSDPQLIYRAIVSPGGNAILPCWAGLDGLTNSIKNVTDCPHHSKLIAASNSASLMKLAGRCLFLVSRRLLVTDLIWPNYLEDLKKECRRTKNELEIVKVRHLITQDGWSKEEIANLIVNQFVQQHCDGLFLTAVSNDGIRLPLDSILESVERLGKVRLTVVDGAQEFAHCESRLNQLSCDLYFFGAHKWLGAYHPMSIGLYGKGRSRDFLELTLQRLIVAREIDDPLMKFTFSLQSNRMDEPNETVNFIPLIAAAGALDDLAQRAGDLGTRLSNARQFADMATESGWKSVNKFPENGFQTGIIVLSNRKYELVNPTLMESRFSRQGIVLTSYPGGRIRVSMPAERFTEEQRDLIASAL